MLAVYSSPIRDRQRIQTSCDSIHDLRRWLLDPDEFINEIYRAGGALLCSLPGQSSIWKAVRLLWQFLKTSVFIIRSFQFLSTKSIHPRSRSKGVTADFGRYYNPHRLWLSMQLMTHLATIDIFDAIVDVSNTGCSQDLGPQGKVWPLPCGHP